MKREQIVGVFEDLDKLKYNGIWFSGVENEGEYKEWYENGQLCIHGFYKNNKLNGEYRDWYVNKKLSNHILYKNGEVIKDYLK